MFADESKENWTDPCFNSSTGVIGSTSIVHALIQRAESGGSYGIDVSFPEVFYNPPKSDPPILRKPLY